MRSCDNTWLMVSWSGPPAMLRAHPVDGVVSLHTKPHKRLSDPEGGGVLCEWTSQEETQAWTEAN